MLEDDESRIATDHIHPDGTFYIWDKNRLNDGSERDWTEVDKKAAASEDETGKDQ